MEKIDIITSILGSSVVAGFFGWIMGKKKEDIEVALKYQEFYEKHIKDLRMEVENLTIKVENLIQQNNLLLESENEKTRTIKELYEIVESQRLTISRYEEACRRNEQIIEQERKNNAKLIKQLEK